VKKADRIRKKEKIFLGAIDLGGTKIASALFTPEGRPVFKSRVAVKDSGGQAVLEQLVSLYYQLEAQAHSRQGRLLATGLCVPGVVNPKSGLVWAPNIKGWKNFRLMKYLRKEIICPLSVISDRTAYVLGESWKGAARGKRNVVYLAVGTGIGAGIMTEGLVVHGEGDLAGAVGWMALQRDFNKGYSRVGCFEWEASGGALARKARALIEANPEAFVTFKATNQIEKNEVEVFCKAARCGQPQARKLVEEIQDYLAMGVANLVSILNPEVVVLGGGLFQSPDLFFKPLKEKFKLWAQPLAARSVRLVLSALGQEAALYGCVRAAQEVLGKEAAGKRGDP